MSCGDLRQRGQVGLGGAPGVGVRDHLSDNQQAWPFAGLRGWSACNLIKAAEQDVFASGRVPRTSTATGVSQSRPAAISPSRTAAALPSPM